MKTWKQILKLKKQEVIKQLIKLGKATVNFDIHILKLKSLLYKEIKKQETNKYFNVDFLIYDSNTLEEYKIKSSECGNPTLEQVKYLILESSYHTQEYEEVKELVLNGDRNRLKQLIQDATSTRLDEPYYDDEGNAYYEKFAPLYAENCMDIYLDASYPIKNFLLRASCTHTTVEQFFMVKEREANSEFIKDTPNSIPF